MRVCYKVKKDTETGLPVAGQVRPIEPSYRTAEGLGVVVLREFTVHTTDLAARAKAKKSYTAAKGAAADNDENAAAAAAAADGAGLNAARVTALCVYQVRVPASEEEPGDGSTAQVKLLAVADGAGGIYAVARNGSLARATKLGRAGDFARDLRKQVRGLVCVILSRFGGARAGDFIHGH